MSQFNENNSPLGESTRIKRFYSAAEICKLTGMSGSFIRREISAGRLIAKKIGRAVRVSEDDLVVYLASFPNHQNDESGA